jgi:lambda family phage portal protein
MRNGKPKNWFQQTFDTLKADYDMSRESRFVRRRVGLAPSGGTADYHIRNESQYYNDIEKARDMDRNDAVIGQTIDRSVANEIQQGFTLDPLTGDRRADQQIKAMWLDWSQDPDQCDIAGEMTFADYEYAASRAAKLDGDCVITGTQDGPLQFFEAHTVGTSSRHENVVLGVELNEYRKRLRYYITQDLIDPHRTGVGRFGATERALEVRDSRTGLRQLFHVYNPKRTTLTRGVTALAPCFQLAGMFEDVNFAKVVQQQIVSCFAIFRKKAYTAGGSLPSVQGYGYSETEPTLNGQTRRIEGIAPGMEVVGEPGEELQGFSPNVPNAEYFDHVKLILQLIGVNLGLPLCLVLMDGSETNFSGWRGAVDEARKGFRRNQLNLIKRFHTPAYRWKLNQFIAADPALRSVAERRGSAFYNHRWNPQQWPYIEPVKDAQGDLLQMRTCLNSPRRIQTNNGRQWDDVFPEIIEDYSSAILAAKKAADKLNRKVDDGQPVHWRDLLPIPSPEGVGVKMDIKPDELSEDMTGGN